MKQMDEKILKGTLTQVDTEGIETLEDVKAEATAQVEKDFQRKKQIQRDDTLVEAKRIVEQFYGAIMISVSRPLPTVEELKSRGEGMSIARLQQEINDLDGELGLYEAFEDKMRARIKELGENLKMQHVFTNDTTLEEIQNYLIEQGAPHGATMPGWFPVHKGRASEDFQAVKKAIPYLQENLSVFKEALRRKEEEAAEKRQVAELTRKRQGFKRILKAVELNLPRGE